MGMLMRWHVGMSGCQHFGTLAGGSVGIFSMLAHAHAQMFACGCIGEVVERRAHLSLGTEN